MFNLNNASQWCYKRVGTVFLELLKEKSGREIHNFNQAPTYSVGGNVQNAHFYTLF